MMMIVMLTIARSAPRTSFNVTPAVVCQL